MNSSNPSSQIQAESFDHPIYSKSIMSNNACIYEIEKLLNQKEIYYDFPFNKQLFYISYIDKVDVYEVEDSEVRSFYEKRQIFSDMYNKDQPRTSFQDYYNTNTLRGDGSLNRWLKMDINYYIEENEKRIYLKDFKVFRKETLKEHLLENQKLQNENSQSQNDDSHTSIKGEEFEVLDGIYYFMDFLEKSFKINDKITVDQYIEKTFEQFNKSVIYSFLSYYVSNCIQSLINARIPIDIDLRNFILLKENQSLKFVYLLTFEDFKIDLEKEFFEKKEQFDYEAFTRDFHVKKSDEVKQEKSILDPKDKKTSDKKTSDQPQTFLTNFQSKQKNLLVQVANYLLNKSDRDECNEDSEFAKNCLEGVDNIEEALKLQDVRKRYCKVLITKNHILTALQNTEVMKDFLLLYNNEQNNFNDQSSNQFNQTNQAKSYCTQSQILNSFFQDCLKKAKAIVPPTVIVNNTANNPNSNSSQKDADQDTIIEYSCEEYPKQQQTGIMPNTVIVSSREKSTTPDFIDTNQKEHEVIALHVSKREMQLQLKIKEVKNIHKEKEKEKEDANTKSKADDTKGGKKSSTTTTTTSQSSANTSANPVQPAEQAKDLDMQLQNQQPLRGSEKKIMIDFKEGNCSISLKFYYQADLFISYENLDEMLFCIQLLNNHFNEISIYMDDNKRLYFETYICIGQNQVTLLRIIYMIDSLITYALTFFDFYYQNMMNCKQSRDTSKYIQLQQEIKQYMKSYQYRFDEFVKKNIKSK